jgi:hypothetical protein
MIPGNVQVTRLAEYVIPEVDPGLYKFELILFDEHGAEIARTMELFFIEASVL